MTRDVLVKISGLQIAQTDDSDPIEMITTGEYFKRKGKHYILYDEIMEDFEGVTKNLIKIDKNKVRIDRKGITNTSMEFEKDRHTQSYYQTPYGNILLDIDPHRCDIQTGEDEIHVDIRYGLEINSEPYADCKIQMSILSKGNDQPCQS